MARSRIATMVASALLTLAAADTKHCYYPDGSNADAGTSPCNTTAAVSACCDPRDSCTTSGLCLGASGWIYRSSCTDQTWSSSACPSQCHVDPILETAYSSYASIYACVAGLYPTHFCCGSYSNKNCCASNFTLGNTGLAFKPGTDAVEAQISSLSAALASATAASSQAGVTTTVTTTANATSSSSSRNLSTAIGAGVGIPLGVLALGILGFLVWRERRRYRDPAAARQGSGVGWPQAKTMSPGQYSAARPGFAGGNAGYGGGSPAWGGAAAAPPPPMSQYVGTPPVHQAEQAWKDPNDSTVSGVGVQQRPGEARHELET